MTGYFITLFVDLFNLDLKELHLTFLDSRFDDGEEEFYSNVSISKLTGEFFKMMPNLKNISFDISGLSSGKSTFFRYFPPEHFLTEELK